MKEITEIFDTLEYGPAPESTEPVDSWLDQHGREFSLWIEGAWHDSSDGAGFETANPATGRPLARITQGSVADVDSAVAAARAAFPAWSGLTLAPAQLTERLLDADLILLGDFHSRRP